MNRSLVLIAALVVAVSLLAACGGGSAATPVPAKQTLTVDLAEWSVKASATSVKAGTVKVTAVNKGVIPHEMHIIKTDLAADALKLKTGEPVVDEATSGTLSGMIHEDQLAAGKTASMDFNLTPGKYVLICNVPTHYQQGMRTVLNVE